MYYFLGNVWLIYEHLRLLFVSKTGKKHKFSLLSWPKTANHQICPWWVAMLLLAWSLEPENSTASHLWCGNFTGYQSGKGSGLRQRFWSSGAFMDWLQHICLSTASWRPAVHICDQPTRACCLFRAHGQPTATGVLLSMEQFTCGKWRHGGDFQKTVGDILIWLSW